MTIELDQVTETIERMKRARPTCDKCATIGFTSAFDMRDSFRPGCAINPYMESNGYELMTDSAGYVKRCAACASGKLFPWADKLDPERVRAFMETDARCQFTFSLDILKETLRDDIPIVRRTGALEAMFAYELAGSEEGARELLRSIEPPELSEPGVACRTCGALSCTKNHAEFM
jgi:hypothetical protein